MNDVTIKGNKIHIKKGVLHKSLGIPLSKKIPEARLMKATHSKSPTLRKRAVFAETLRHFNHRGNR